MGRTNDTTVSVADSSTTKIGKEPVQFELAPLKPVYKKGLNSFRDYERFLSQLHRLSELANNIPLAVQFSGCVLLPLTRVVRKYNLVLRSVVPSDTKSLFEIWIKNFFPRDLSDCSMQLLAGVGYSFSLAAHSGFSVILVAVGDPLDHFSCPLGGILGFNLNISDFSKAMEMKDTNNPTFPYYWNILMTLMGKEKHYLMRIFQKHIKVLFLSSPMVDKSWTTLPFDLDIIYEELFTRALMTAKTNHFKVCLFLAKDLQETYVASKVGFKPLSNLCLGWEMDSGKLFLMIRICC